MSEDQKINPIKKNVRKLSRIIIIQIPDIVIVRKMFQNVIVSDIQFLSRICSGQIFVRKSDSPKMNNIHYHLYDYLWLFISFKLYIIDSIFARSAILLRRWRLVLNVNFEYFTFFWFFYKINLSIFRNSCPKFVRNFLMSRICPV